MEVLCRTFRKVLYERANNTSPCCNNFLCVPSFFFFQHEHSCFSFFLNSLTHTYLCLNIYRRFPCLLRSCLPPWVIVVFGVRQERQSLQPPRCVPAKLLPMYASFFFWPDRLKHLWKTTSAPANPASSFLPTEKQCVEGCVWGGDTVDLCRPEMDESHYTS